MGAYLRLDQFLDHLTLTKIEGAMNFPPHIPGHHWGNQQVKHGKLENWRYYCRCCCGSSNNGMCFELSTSYFLISTEEISRLQKEKLEGKGLWQRNGDEIQTVANLGALGQIRKNRRAIRASGAWWQAHSGSLPSSLGTGVCCSLSRKGQSGSPNTHLPLEVTSTHMSVRRAA